MGIIIAASNIKKSFPLDANIDALVVICLIISIYIELLIIDSKYWNTWASSTLNAITIPLLITFAFIIFYKIILLV
jgi:hypothetical protein